MRFPATRTLGLVAFASLFAGCAIDRTSVLTDSGPIQTSWQDHFKVVIVAVDGQSQPAGPVALSPGRHDVTFAARPDVGVPLPATKTIAMSIIPCTEYRMVARPGPASAQDWNVLIEDSNPTGDCAGRGSTYSAIGNATPTGTSPRN